MRYNEVDRARAVFDRYVEILPSVKAWVRYAKFELQNNDVARARSCYERAMEALGEDANTVCINTWGTRYTYTSRSTLNDVFGHTAQPANLFHLICSRRKCMCRAYCWKEALYNHSTWKTPSPSGNM